MPDPADLGRHVTGFTSARISAKSPDLAFDQPSLLMIVRIVLRLRGFGRR